MNHDGPDPNVESLRAAASGFLADLEERVKRRLLDLMADAGRRP